MSDPRKNIRAALERVHREASRPLGELALHLERGSVTRRQTVLWSAQLTAAAESLKRVLE